MFVSLLSNYVSKFDRQMSDSTTSKHSVCHRHIYVKNTPTRSTTSPDWIQMIQNCLVKPTLHEGMYNNICCHTNSEVVQAFAFSIALYLFTYET